MTKELRTDAAAINDLVAYFDTNRSSLDVALASLAAKHGLSYAGSPTAALGVTMEALKKEAAAALVDADKHDSASNESGSAGQSVEAARRVLRTTVADVKTGLTRVYGSARMHGVFGPGSTPAGVEQLEGYARAAAPNLADWKTWPAKSKAGLTFDGDQAAAALTAAVAAVSTARSARSSAAGERKDFFASRDEAASALHDMRIHGAKMLVAHFGLVGDSARASHVMTHHHEPARSDEPPPPAGDGKGTSGGAADGKK